MGRKLGTAIAGVESGDEVDAKLGEAVGNSEGDKIIGASLVGDSVVGVMVGISVAQAEVGATVAKTPLGASVEGNSVGKIAGICEIGEMVGN